MSFRVVAAIWRHLNQSRRRGWLLMAFASCPAFLCQGQVVINEIHYAPDVKTEPVEFVELHNPQPQAVDVSGWRLSGGVAYQFPPNRQIPPGGFIVVGENPSALRTKFGIAAAEGPWTGRLSNQGDRVELVDASGRVVDQVEYQLGFPWPTVGAPPGFSIELINPSLDNDLGGSWRRSVVGDVSQADVLLPERSWWRYLPGYSEASDPPTAWRAPGFDDGAWLAGPASIGYGEPFVATPLEDMRNNYSSVFFRSVFAVSNPAEIAALLLEAQYDDGIKVWINGRNVVNANLAAGEVPFNATASTALENAAFVPFALSAPAAYLVEGANVIAVQAHNSSLTASGDFFFDLRLTAQKGLANRGPTPGARNSVYAGVAPPQVRQVRHAPDQPASGEPVKITAKVTDPDGVASVTLQYQIVEPGAYIELSDAAYKTSWTSAAMNDRGTAGDDLANDGIFTVVLAGDVQAHRRLIRYRLVSTDGGGEAVQSPAPDDLAPNFAYFVYDGVPDWSGAIQPASADPARSTAAVFGPEVTRRLPVYHLISKKSSVEQSTWLERYGGDLYKWKGTLVYDGKVYDHIGYRARGGVWRYAMGKNMWKFDFNRGHDFEPRDNYGRKYKTAWTKLNLGACIQQGDYQHRGEQGMFESVGFRLFNLAGVEAPKSHFVQFRIIDEAAESNPANQYSGDFWGLYLALEQEDGRFLDEHALPDGNFYKMEAGTGELNNQGFTGASDKSDLNAFMAMYRNNGTPDSWWRQNFDLDRYYSYQAIVQGIHHYDICYGKNYFYYRNPVTRLWSVHPWDLDLTWADNMYDAGCGGTDEFKDRVLQRPAFALEFRNRVREVRDLLFNADQAWQLIDEYAALIDDPAGGPSVVDADRAMWDYHPIMADRNRVNLSKAGQGRFYQVVSTKDFPGMVNKMKNYILTRGAILDELADDPLIPDTPVIASDAAGDVPADRLSFRVSDYAGANAFAAVKWRLGEISPTNSSVYTSSGPRAYEIDSVWDTVSTQFSPSVTVPAGAVKVGSIYRLRARMQDSTGRWSHWSAPLEFKVSAITGSDSLVQNLRLTELMYNPPAGSDAEFVELHNTSSTQSLDLNGVKFTQGIDYTFPPGAVLPPGGYLLVVRAANTGNFASFRALYGLGAETPIYGPFSGGLDNNGEPIVLRTAAGGDDIAAFEYGDGRGWPIAADGAGHSLVPMELALPNEANGSLNYPGNWRASTYINGSPGRADPPPVSGIVLNELVAHTDFLGEEDSNDWLELMNPTSAAVTLGPGWFLSDDAANLRKWQIPAATVIPAGGRVAFDEVTGFHNPPTTGFGLSKDGEQVFLSYLAGTATDRVVDSVAFKAQENEWSLGRWPDGVGLWQGLTPATRGSLNAVPPNRVVVNEIMFHPQGTDANPDDNVADEYIEIYNPLRAAVPLWNTDGVWRLDGGVKFLFPANNAIPGNGVLLLVSFSPTNSAALAAFRSRYGIGLETMVLGPYEGKLNNSTDRVAIERPQGADLTNAPPAWVIVDEVIYADQAPWPSGADGTGAALQRVSAPVSGNDPGNWRSAAPTPGRLSAPSSDADQDGMPDDWETANGLNPNLAADAALDSDGDGLTNLQEYQAGSNPRDSASALRLTAAPAPAGGIVLRFNAVSGRSYTVFSRQTLAQGAWQTLAAVPSATSDHVVELPRETLKTQEFYRVQVDAGP